MKKILLCLALMSIYSMNSTAAPVTADQPEEDELQEINKKIDDWQLDLSSGQGSSMSLTGPPVPVSMSSPGAFNASVPRQVSGYMPGSAVNSKGAHRMSRRGFAVGGAKDTKNFLQNITSNYLPKYSSITYEGLFYDYYFDTGLGAGTCKELFCPSYARAVTKDLYSGETDYYLSIGLNSGIDDTDLQRKKLNIVVVLDISGSMGSRFDEYHYNGNHNQPIEKKESNKSKMQIANEAIVAMMKHLLPEDRFGVVLFDNRAYKAKPLRLVSQTDMQAISKHILAINDRGGTNWRAGFDEGVNLFTPLQKTIADPTIYENRIIFLTDAMPNTGELSKEGLFGMVKKAADNGIHTSFIGIGIDFNPDLVEQVTKTRGANYFSVKSSSEFKKRMDKEFDFMVTPLVYDLALQIKSQDYKIEGVFGSPEADFATGEVMKINTLFPSATEEDRVKGGVVLIKLKKTGKGNSPINLTVSYKNRSGKEFTSTDSTSFAADKIGFDNNGIRKAVLLTEYVSLVKNWLLDAHKGCNDQVERPVILPLFKCGLINPEGRPEIKMVSEWERKSCPLDVSDGYQKFFTLFSNHFTDEMKKINDPTLKKELKVLNILTKKEAASSNQPVDDWKLKR